jgi:hypothetical protein
MSPETLMSSTPVWVSFPSSVVSGLVGVLISTWPLKVKIGSLP